MRGLGVLFALATVAAGSWLGDEYWTLIGPNGKPIQGDPANFARVAHYFKPDEHNRFVAFWMTNNHYPGRMFEQFGEAFLNEDEDGKYCARFTGERGEAVEVCQNFRILTVPERFRGRTIFEWVKIDAINGQETDKVGYNDHRICAFAYDPEETAAGVKYSDFTFGDAIPSKSTANAVNKRIGITSTSFDNYLLRLLVGENHAQQSIPRLPPPPAQQPEPHLAHRQYAERQPNVQEQQAQQDAEYQRRLAEYNERLRQQKVEQQQQRDQYDQQHRQQQQQPVQQQQQHTQPQAVGDMSFICDAYGRVFELKKGEDGRSKYVTYDLDKHGGVRPPCTFVGEHPNQTGRVEGGEQRQQQQEQRPYPIRRSCSGSRKKKDAEAEDDC